MRHLKTIAFTLILGLHCVGACAQVKGQVSTRRYLAFATLPEALSNDRMLALRQDFRKDRAEDFKPKVDALGYEMVNISNEVVLVYDPVIVAKASELTDELAKLLGKNKACSFGSLPKELQNLAHKDLSNGRNPRKPLRGPSDDAVVGFAPTVSFTLVSAGKSIPIYISQDVNKETDKKITDPSKFNEVTDADGAKWKAWKNKFASRWLGVATYNFGVPPDLLADTAQETYSFVSKTIQENSEIAKKSMLKLMDQLMAEDYRVEKADGFDSLSQAMQSQVRDKCLSHMKEMGFVNEAQMDRWLGDARINRVGYGMQISIGTGYGPSEGFVESSIEIFGAVRVR